MLDSYLTLLGFVALGMAVKAGGALADEPGGRFEERLPDFKRIIPTGATIEKLDTGFKFTEGPVWDAGGSFLLFSDIPANKILQWRPGAKACTFRDPSGNSNGLTLDKSRRLIACEYSTRRVTPTELDGTVSILADHYQGRRLNSSNDVVVQTDGSIYFTNPSFGLGDTPKWKELPSNGVCCITPNGALTLLVDDFKMSNGLAFSSPAREVPDWSVPPEAF